MNELSAPLPPPGPAICPPKPLEPTSPLDIYLEEIGTFPVLTPEQEIEPVNSGIGL